ncbi:MAG: helix-turn-helix domain-containing protein [Gemmatimonadaceae bacterium]
MPVTKRTSRNSVVTATVSFPVTPKSSSSTSISRLAKRLRVSASFWTTWLRKPGLDVAESAMRLRRLRGMSQQQLARKLGTKQPAVARLESGTANPRLSTIVELAEALGATVRIEMEPVEHLGRRQFEPRVVPWWESFAQSRDGLGIEFSVSLDVPSQTAAVPPSPLRKMLAAPAIASATSAIVQRRADTAHPAARDDVAAVPA